MAFSKKHRRGIEGAGDGHDLMITPLLDLFVALIPFLIMSVVLSRLNVIDVGIQTPSSSSKAAPHNERDITLRIYMGRAEIFVDQKRTAVVQRVEGKNWFDETHSRLVEIKKQKLEDLRIHIETQERVSLDVVMGFMDTVRELKAEDGEIFKKDEKGMDVKLRYLFPQVILKGVYS